MKTKTDFSGKGGRYLEDEGSRELTQVRGRGKPRGRPSMKAKRSGENEEETRVGVSGTFHG